MSEQDKDLAGPTGLIDPRGGRKVSKSELEGSREVHSGDWTARRYEEEMGYKRGSVTYLPEEGAEPDKDPNYQPAYERRKKPSKPDLKFSKN